MKIVKNALLFSAIFLILLSIGTPENAFAAGSDVYSWGYNTSGQLGDGTYQSRLTPVPATGLSGFTAIACGGGHSVALKSDGTVWAWGASLVNGSSTNELTSVQVPGLTDITAIACGRNHSLALKSDGTVWAWGINNNGQLGDGTTTNSSAPVRVSGLTNVISIAGGGKHSMALKTDGTVWAWGDNQFGQLGNNAGNSLSPVQVVDPGDASTYLTGVTAISAGGDFSIALKANGTVWAWGYNGFGELGNGTNTDSATPVQVYGLAGVKTIASGDFHSIALMTDGTAWAWGYNETGALGDGTTFNWNTPVPVSTLSGITAIACGSQNSVAMKADGTVWAWGINYVGQLGNGTTTDSLTPVQVSGMTGVTAISCGWMYALALKTSVKGVAWGDNYYSQLGDNSNTDSGTPVAVSGLTGGFTTVTGCGNHSLALKSDGTVWTWGYNGSGELGDGTYFNSPTPIPVPGLTGVTAIAGGDDFSLALKTDGTVWAWGSNVYGQLGDGTATNSPAPVQVSGLTGVVAIASGARHSIALMADGTVWGWGLNWCGELGDGSSSERDTPVQVMDPGDASTYLTGIKAIDAGYVHSIALKADGTVWAWGSNESGQLGYGTYAWSQLPVQVKVDTSAYLTAVKAIASGNIHSIALESDGTVRAWGYNSFGQLGDGTYENKYSAVEVTSLGGVMAIACGNQHSIALKSDGTVRTWGDNSDGQLGDGTTTNSPVPVQISGLTMVTAIAGGESHSLALYSAGDTTPPASSITDPTDGVTLSGIGHIITGTATDGTGSGVQKVEVGITPPGSSSPTWSTATLDTSSGQISWSINWNPLVDGVYTIQSIATDNAGNVEALHDGVTVSVINNSLILTGYSQNGTSVTVSASMHYKGNPASGKTITFYNKLGSVGYASMGTATTNTSGVATKTFTASLGSNTMYAAFKASGGVPAMNSGSTSYTVGKVALVSPANATTVTSATPTLSWASYSPDTMKYHVQISTSSTFAAGHFKLDTDTPDASTTIVTTALTKGTTYYWRVLAFIPTGKTGYSNANKMVYKSATALSIVSVTQDGLKVKIKAALTGDLGAALGGKTIGFYEGATSKASGTTAADGTCTATITSTIGSHNFVVKFAGNATYAPAVSPLEPVVIGKVTLFSPLNTGVVSDTDIPWIVWSDYANGTGTYHIQVATASTFGTSTIYDTDVTYAAYQVPSPLTIGKTYYWRVLSYLPNGKSAYSDTWNFKCKYGTDIAYEGLTQNGLNVTLSFRLRYHGGEPVSGKTLSIYEGTTLKASGTTDADGIMTKTFTSTLGDHFFTTKFTGNAVYDQSTYDSTYVTIRKMWISSPDNGTTDVHSTYSVFGWLWCSCFTGYHIQVATASTFGSSIVYDATLSDSYCAFPSALTVGKKYYWRVQGLVTAGTSVWSDTWSFTY